jgi:hypothetical protein
MTKAYELSEIIDRCLEGIEAGTWDLADCLAEFPEQRAELKVMLPIALSLREVASMRIPEESRRSASDRLQQRLQASGRPPGVEFVTESPSLRSMLRTWNPFRQRRVGRMPALISIFLAIAALVTGTAVGADAAGPGDLLYGVDLAVEQVQLWLTIDDESEVELQLEFASERLEEAELEIEAEGDTAAIDEALAAFDELMVALEPLFADLTPEQQAELAEMMELLQSSREAIEELEFSIEIEDGEVKIEIEAEFEGEHLEGEDLDDDDEFDDDELDDDELDDDELNDEHDEELEEHSDCEVEHDDDDDDEHDDEEDDDDCDSEHDDDEHDEEDDDDEEDD